MGLRAQLMAWAMFIFPVNKTKEFFWHRLHPACHFLSCWLSLCLGPAYISNQTVSFLKPRSLVVHCSACGFLPSHCGAQLIKQKTCFWWGTGADLVRNRCDSIIPKYSVSAHSLSLCLLSFSLPDVVACFWRNIIWGYDMGQGLPVTQ